MTGVLPGTAATAPPPAVDAASAGNREGYFRGGAGTDVAADGEPAPGRCASLRSSLVEQGYVPARFGGIPVLVGPRLAAQLRALREQQP